MRYENTVMLYTFTVTYLVLTVRQMYKLKLKHCHKKILQGDKL